MTNTALYPPRVPATPVFPRPRLESALARFDREVRARALASDTVTSGAFGTVPVVDYARFIEIHMRHHCKQMPTAMVS